MGTDVIGQKLVWDKKASTCMQHGLYETSDNNVSSATKLSVSLCFFMR